MPSCTTRSGGGGKTGTGKSCGAAAFQRPVGVTGIAHAGKLDYTDSSTRQRSVGYRRDILGSDMQGFVPVEADVLPGGTLNQEGRAYPDAGSRETGMPAMARRRVWPVSRHLSPARGESG